MARLPGFSPCRPSRFLRTIDDDLDRKLRRLRQRQPTRSRRPSASRRACATRRKTRITTFDDAASSTASLPRHLRITTQGKWDDWSPMASIDWHAAEDVMVYAKVAKGFKSGGFNGREQYDWRSHRVQAGNRLVVRSRRQEPHRRSADA